MDAFRVACQVLGYPAPAARRGNPASEGDRENPMSARVGENIGPTVTIYQLPRGFMAEVSNLPVGVGTETDIIREQLRLAKLAVLDRVPDAIFGDWTVCDSQTLVLWFTC